MTLTAGPLRYILFTTICAGTFTLGTAGLLHDDGKIAEGVYVEQVYVGGQTPQEANETVRRELLSRVPERIELSCEGRRWWLANNKFHRWVGFDEAVQSAYQLTRKGGRLQNARERMRVARRGASVPVPVHVDRPKLEALLGEVAEKVDREPRDARVSAIIDGHPQFEPEQEGQRVNLLASSEAVLGRLSFPPPARVDLVVESVAPKVRAADLRSSLTSVLGQFTTSMSDGYFGVMRENRAHNVGLLLKRMNGKILLPGEEWSFNRDLGERKVQDGFRPSIVFMRRPDGTIEERWSTGGGICQLASTIFNAVLYANLGIVERSNHSKTVHYVRPARDATVYYGQADLRFRNTLAHPILLWGELKPNLDLEITILGDQADRTQVTLDSDLWYGRAGKGGTLWRTVKAPDGTMVRQREQICESFYPYETKDAGPD